MVNIKQKSTNEWLKSYEDDTPVTTIYSTERLALPLLTAQTIILELGDDWKLLQDNQCLPKE